MNPNHHWKIGIQEDMLPGPTLADCFHQAADLGLQGLEFWSASLPAKAAEIEKLIGRGGVVAASVNNGHRSRFLDPFPAERQRAMDELTEAMTLSSRIGASGVVYVPHFSVPLLPDLLPWMDAVALERSLLSAQLEILAEHAQHYRVQLWVESVNRYETHLLNRLEDSASLVAPIGNPHLGIVADLFHMALEETDIPTAILDQGQWIGHVHLADSNRRLPGLGTTDFSKVLTALSQAGYSGWLVLECDQPGDNQPRSPWYMEHLADSVALFR